MDYNLFIDSDIFLDILLIRHPHFYDSISLFSLQIENQVQLFTTPSILLNTNYIAYKQYNKEKAKKGVAEIIKLVEIIETSKIELVIALIIIIQMWKMRFNILQPLKILLYIFTLQEILSISILRRQNYQ